MIKKYEKYKDSGVEWIGEIPEEWEVKKVKYLTENFDGKRIPLNSTERSSIQGDYPYYGATGVVDYVNGYIFDGSYVLIGEDGAPFFIFGKDVAFHVEGKFWINNHAHILRPIKDNPIILTHLFNSVDYKNYISGSTRDKLTQDQLNSIQLLEIPLPEQTAIASFLDRKTAEIDQLIANKEKLIALYEEEKAAIIGQAVTKGLDPTVKTKPSSIEWLGEIPEHWEVMRLKRLSSKITDGEHISPTFTLVGMPFLSAKDVRDNQLIFTNDKFVSFEDGEKFRKRCNPEKNDLLLVSRGATIGRVAIVDTEIEFCLLGSVILIKPSENIIPTYLLYSLKNKLLQDNFLLTSQSSAQQAIYLVSVVDIGIACPKIDEQIAIVSHIETECSRLDTIIEKFKKQIELFKEYRTTLISEVVTGKIDVRDEVAA